ncbi:MAG: methyltransferase [Proteobacteria bacterium]|nr:methyltransferase [Pseudomonadota bacterium]
MTSGNLIADRRYQFAGELKARGEDADAADLLSQTLELAPHFAPAWFMLGELRLRGGERAGAIEAFARARAADPDDRLGAGLQLARLEPASAAGVAPGAYVRTLFDQYAQRFDRAIARLGYRAPELICAALASLCQARGVPFDFASVLDVGCGTGLCGAALRPHAGRLVGVDVSPPMLAQARAKGHYDRLVAADMLQFAVAEARGRERYHLIVAADVFVYAADLTPVLAVLAALLHPGGLFTFSVETHGGEGVVVGAGLRFSHAAEHVDAAVANANLHLLQLAACATRTENTAPVAGLLAIAAKA